MSLRWRFAVALALLGAVVVALAGVVAYETTASRLSSSVDQSLESAAALLVHQLPATDSPGASRQGLGPGTGLPSPSAGTGQTGQSSQSSQSSQSGQSSQAGQGGQLSGRPRPRESPPPDLLNLVSEQRLGASGAVTDRSSTIAFPVSPADRELAASGGPDRLVTVTADGDPYRVITAALPAGGAIQLGRDVRENNQLLASLRERVGLVDLLVIVLSALVGWFVASRMTRSLTVLTRATEQVAREGLLAATISTEGHDEIGRLGRSFSTMLTALTRSRRLQQQLIEDAAHELRTPLTSLRVNIDLLRRHATELQPGQREAILADLDGELAELSGLVTELVELGTDRRAEEPMRPVLVDEIARTCAERISTRLGREIVVEGSRWPVQGQHDALDRAVSNLLENAAKFSPPASRIEVAVVPGRIEVRDHGTGIDPVELTAIFDRFHRSATARGLPGSGLGLAIVKDIVSRHGGTVFAENAPDGGAVVGFTLGVSSD